MPDPRIDRTDLADHVEALAQTIHQYRHRAGTASACGACRDEAIRELADPESPPRWSARRSAAFVVCMLAAAAAVVTGLMLQWPPAAAVFALAVGASAAIGVTGTARGGDDA